jgi:hypothetical protein
LNPSFAEDQLRALEAQASLVDELAEYAQTDNDHASVSAKRRFLLLELDAAGLFDPMQAAQIRLQLEGWQLPVLLGYHKAAMELHGYIHSPERRRFNPTAGTSSIDDAMVSIDWFRRSQPHPSTYTPYEWLSYCESLLRREVDFDGGMGEIFTKIDRRWARLVWRKDNGVDSKLLSATLVNL